jgi:putative tryptophan/tyrosine transport system substrate-binding protein
MGKRGVILGLSLIVLTGLGFAWFLMTRGDFPPQGDLPNQNANLPSPSKVPYKVCVAQYVSHPLLDSVYSGFKEELSRTGFDLRQIEFFNANNDRTAAQILADQFCNDKCDLIFVLATPMAQSTKAACPPTKPILFGAITDPRTAGLVKDMNSPGSNLTGTSDQWPYSDQMELIAQLWGSTTRVGVPFNPGEANTQYAMEQTRSAAQRIGLKLVEVPVNNLLEATQAIDALVGRVDLIYLPADNTVIAAGPGIIASADRHNLPVVAGDPGTFKAGAVVGLGVNYKNLGVINAQQALKILKGANPRNMRVEISNQPELYINDDKARRFSLNVEKLKKWYSDRTSH